jgi:hypothetical protein
VLNAILAANWDDGAVLLSHGTLMAWATTTVRKRRYQIKVLLTYGNVFET